MKIRLALLRYLFLFLLLIPFSTTYALKDQDADVIQIHNANVPVGQHVMAYSWSGEGPDVVLLHGLFASKSQWREFIKILADKGYHAVAPDLPGFGKSIGYPLADYSLENQVILLHEFVTKLNLKKIQLAGNSMGGLIAALYAKKYPSEVKTLAFIGAPLGVQSPKSSPTDKLLAKGINPFIPLTEDQLNQELELLFNNPPELTPDKIQAILARQNEKKEENNKIWLMVYAYHLQLNKPLELDTPTLIMWGMDDRVFDVSGAPILQKNINGSKLMYIYNGSHLLFMEDPEFVAKKYITFLKRYS